MNSILSTEERKVATALREGATVEEVAADQDKPVATVERAVERIHEKTERALATLAESPFTAEAAAARPDAERERVRNALCTEKR